MAISSTYYLNAPSLGSATAVFTDADLSICADDGFYSDGVISRELVDCVLLPQQTCPSCTVPCGTTISLNGYKGFYLLDLNTGGAVGAVIIRFNPYSIPDGIKATLGSSVYNALTSSVDGFHQSSTSGHFTYVGETGDDCGISGTTYPALTEFIYNGSGFIATGNTQSITVSAGDVSLGATAPGSCLMVIPKLTASPSIINFELVGPCAEIDWEISIYCPALLTGFSSSVMAASSAAACLLSETVTYYNASLASTPGIVGLYDFVYSDAYGATPLAAGFYHAAGSIASSKQWFQVDSNGVVIATGLCSGVSAYGGDVWFGTAASTGGNNACSETAPQQYLWWGTSQAFYNGLTFYTNSSLTTPWVNTSGYTYCRSDGSGGGFNEFNLSSNVLGTATGTIC